MLRVLHATRTQVGINYKLIWLRGYAPLEIIEIRYCLAIALATRNFKGAIKSISILQSTRIRRKNYKHESIIETWPRVGH